MLKNYLKIALRNLTKHKVYSAINIFGLAVGIACCTLIMLFVNNEWSYDEFHSNSDRLYRAWGREDYGEGEVYFYTVTPLILAPTLEANIPEVETVSRLFRFTNLVRQSEADESLSQGITVVDPEFFSMFDFELLSGAPETVFSTPNSVVLTPETAARFFGETDVRGQTLLIRLAGEFREFSVTGIIEEPPVNSSIRFGMLIPFSNSRDIFSENAHQSWFNISPETWVLLNENADKEQVEAKFPAIMKQALGEERYAESNYELGLQPIIDVHLNTGFPTGIAPVSDPVYSYILGAIALLILVIACANFMTLSISRSTSRAREVGIRKTIGAQRRHLMYQFWGEALLMTLLALGLGMIVAELLLPFFNSLSGTGLALGFSLDTLLFLGGVAAFISLVAGIYPALILSGFKPVEVLKGKLQLSGDKSLVRQGMVVFQFTLSIMLMAGTFIIIKQLNYIRSADLGYAKDRVVVLETGIRPGPGNPLTKVTEEALRLKNRMISETAANPDVAGISMSAFTPVQAAGWFSADFSEQNGRRRYFHFNVTDHDFLNTYDIDVVQGRGFSEQNTSDARRAIIVNQALVDDYGWDNPIGQRLSGPEFEDHEIIGVVKDFHFESMHTEIAPLVLAVNPMIPFSGIDNITYSTASPRLSVRLNTADLSPAMDELKQAWAAAVPGTPFTYTFVDEAVDSQYRQEERLSRIAGFGSTLAIVIACLGLFGLASLMVVRRTKEIGVRKVLGASSAGIMLLINKEFTRMVGIAFLIATPLAWYLMNQWLKDFAYREEISIGIFLLAGTATLLIAWLTVSWQSVKAALMNPVESLRSE